MNQVISLSTFIVHDVCVIVVQGKVMAAESRMAGLCEEGC